MIASHIAEHVDDPDAFCRELARASKAGYIETPSPRADEVSWSRNAIDRFVDAARRDLGRCYVLVGCVADAVMTDGLAEPPHNLILAGYGDDDELHALLWSSGMYAQFSWHEGFGVATDRRPRLRAQHESG